MTLTSAVLTRWDFSPLPQTNQSSFWGVVHLKKRGEAKWT